MSKGAPRSKFPDDCDAALTAVMAVGAFSNSGDLSIENVLSQELKNRGSINPLFFYFHILQLRQLYSNLICFKKLLLIMLSLDKRNPD